jgi:hypothetical protein
MPSICIRQKLYRSSLKKVPELLIVKRVAPDSGVVQSIPAAPPACSCSGPASPGATTSRTCPEVNIVN